MFCRIEVPPDKKIKMFVVIFHIMKGIHEVSSLYTIKEISYRFILCKDL